MAVRNLYDGGATPHRAVPSNVHALSSVASAHRPAPKATTKAKLAPKLSTKQATSIGNAIGKTIRMPAVQAKVTTGTARIVGGKAGQPLAHLTAPAPLKGRVLPAPTPVKAKVTPKATQHTAPATRPVRPPTKAPAKAKAPGSKSPAVKAPTPTSSPAPTQVMQGGSFLDSLLGDVFPIVLIGGAVLALWYLYSHRKGK